MPNQAAIINILLDSANAHITQSNEKEASNTSRYKKLANHVLATVDKLQFLPSKHVLIQCIKVYNTTQHNQDTKNLYTSAKFMK